MMIAAQPQKTPREMRAAHWTSRRVKAGEIQENRAGLRQADVRNLESKARDDISKVVSGF